MRRNDREITDIKEICGIILKCDVCRIALNNKGFPYIIPLNFGYCVQNGKITLYFHGAAEGTKHELIAADNRTGFEMDCSHRLVLDSVKGRCTMEYQSVAGTGMITPVTDDEEKYRALCHIMKHYRSGDFPINKPLISKTAVFMLTVEQITAKSHIVK